MRTLASPITLLLSAAALLVAAGCGGADQSGSGGTTEPATTPAGLTHATGPNDVVLRIETGGGFVPVEFNLRALPEYTLYGDGTVLMTPAGDPTTVPPVPPLETAKLDEAAIQKLLTAAQGAGLLTDATPDYGDMGSVGVSDMPTTTVTLNVDGKQASHGAYGLSMGGAEPAGQLTQAQLDARAALRGFVDLAKQHDPNATAYAPTRVLVYAGPSLEQPDVETGAEPATWPLASELATLGEPVSSGLAYRCAVVEGDDATKLVEAVQKAPQNAQWVGGSDRNATFQLVVRPLLPDEAGCPA